MKFTKKNECLRHRHDNGIQRPVPNLHLLTLHFCYLPDSSFHKLFTNFFQPYEKQNIFPTKLG